jgi:HAD superfamily hydrolase (TIGR01662 family)
VIRAVVFDVGEALVDETREYGSWADWLGVPRHTFSAVFGHVIATGRDHRESFQVFRPGFDLDAERQARADAGRPETFGEEDLYPDVRPALERLRALRLQVGVVGNQTARAESILRSLGLPVDWIATSAGWGVEKPEPEFFDRVVAETGAEPDEVLYVGDRLDNDIRPALAAGLHTVLVRRGPWGVLLSDPVAEKACLAVLDDLSPLPGLVAEHNRQAAAQAAR